MFDLWIPEVPLPAFHLLLWNWSGCIWQPRTNVWVAYGTSTNLSNECLCIPVQYSSSCCICLFFEKQTNSAATVLPVLNNRTLLCIGSCLRGKKVSLWTTVFCWSRKPISVQISLLLLCQLWPNNKRLLNDRKSSSEFLHLSLLCSQLS